MSDDGQTQFSLDLDNQSFVSAVLEAKESLAQLADSNNLQGLVEGFMTVGAVIGTVGVALFAMKEVFDATLDAEQIQSVNTQFEMLTKQAGIAGDALKSGLVGAADGTMTETELLKSANIAMLNMGSSAAKLPELLEVARKAGAVTGQDTATAFANLSRAVEFGNQRLLKHSGILVDVNAAQKIFAQSIGASVGTLTDAEKQQALLNAVLDFGNTKLKDVDPSARKATTAWQQFKVAISEVGEEMAKSVSSSGMVAGFFTSITGWLTGVKLAFQDNFGSGVEAAQAHVSRLQIKIEDTKASIDALNKDPFSSVPFTSANARLVQLKDSLVAYNQELVQASANQQKMSKSSPGDDAAAEKAAADARIAEAKKVAAAREKGEEDFRKKKLTLDQDELKDDTQKATTSEQVQANEKQRELLLYQETEMKKKQIKADTTLNDVQKTQLMAAEDAKYNRDKQADDQKVAQAEILASQNRMYQAKHADEQIAASSRNTALKTIENWKQAGGAGGAAVSDFSTQYMSAMTAIGQGTESATQIMQGFFFSMIGSYAEQWGAVYMAQGIASYDYVQAAEGAALMSLGAIISGMGNGSSSSPAVSSASGGTTGGPAPVNVSQVGGLNVPAASQTTATQGTNVTFQVSGNMFNSDETKRWLMDTIRGYQDASNYTFAQIGKP